VGGCIRDAILGKVPADWDVATDAQPEDVKLILTKSLRPELNMERLLPL